MHTKWYKNGIISIHPPRVGWDGTAKEIAALVVISIHPPRVGWDHPQRPGADPIHISIHPPRVGWDTLRF